MKTRHTEFEKVFTTVLANLEDDELKVFCIVLWNSSACYEVRQSKTIAGNNEAYRDATVSVAFYHSRWSSHPIPKPNSNSNSNPNPNPNRNSNANPKP